MKTRHLFYSLFVLLIAFSSCEKENFSYTPVVAFNFQSGENLVTTEKGATTYTVTGTVTSTTGLRQFVIKKADAKSGKEGAEIEGTRQEFAAESGQMSYEFSYTFSTLEENKAICLNVTDNEGANFKKNFVVKITPSVIFSDGNDNLESVDKLYGSFYGEWFEGRVYKSRDAGQYAAEVNIAMSENGGQAIFISPAIHQSTFAGAQATTYALTTLKAADFDAISQVDDSALKTLTTTATSVIIAKDNVYAYTTAGGQKGLILVNDLTHTDKTAIDPAVFTAKITTKVQAK